VAAILVDLQRGIRERVPLMLPSVACVMFVVPFFVFGSITLPIKAMIMSSLSLTASFGAPVWVFQTAGSRTSSTTRPWASPTRRNHC
jgi:RND superfamily putative drug exporter